MGVISGTDLTHFSPIEGQISTNLHVIFTYLFDVISLIEEFTLFPRTIFDVILMVEKSTLFPRIFFGVISLIEKSTSFPRILLDIISLAKYARFST